MIKELTRVLLNHYGVSIKFLSEGLMTFEYESAYRGLSVHLYLLPRHEHRSWGHTTYEGAPMHDFGLGPFLLVSYGEFR